MHIVLLTHPAFMPSQSMPRFAQMLEHAYRDLGHDVEVWSPKDHWHRRMAGSGLAKWAGYADQYLVFPRWLKGMVKRQPPDTLFVLTDQALGPWMPWVRHRPHVVHVHDLLALRSALGEVPQNPTRFTGRMYQRYIRRGFSMARSFICISNRTRTDLMRLSGANPDACEVVYNGLNAPFAPMEQDAARRVLESAGLPDAPRGMVLHVSGNQWYKNVAGVVRIYSAYARARTDPLPLWLIGVRPGPKERAALAELPAQATVHFAHGLSHETLQACYSTARAFLFPSHAEGFGWPIVEAQACGCPVLTTDDAPMNEIGGPVAAYLPRLQPDSDARRWAERGGHLLDQMAHAAPTDAQRRSAAAVAWAARFRSEAAIQGYLRIYRQVLSAHGLGERELAELRGG